ncbi:MAG: o-succinylbenzoate--CoA ligase [Ignavibacteriaceae bacterium]
MYYQLLKNIAKENPEAVAFYVKVNNVLSELKDFVQIISEDSVLIKYSDFYLITERIILGMRGFNDFEGKYVGLLAENNFETVAILYAVWGSGKVPVLLNPKLTEEELAKIIEVSGNIRILDGEEAGLLIKNSLGISDFCDEDRREERGGDDTAVILATSGTGGRVKLAELSFNNYYQSFINSKKELNYCSEDRWLLSLPIFHSGGLSIILRALFSRASVILESQQNISQGIFPTKLSLVQTQLKRRAEENFQGIDEGAVVLLGGGPIEVDLMRNAIEKGLRVIKVFGSTETASMVTGLRGEDFAGREISAGKAFENVEIAILNRKGEKVKTGESGEIAIKSESVFKGYLNNREETEKRFFDGYYLTGDVGYLDGEGFLFVLGRKDEMIISGGEKISPEEVERLIKEYPGIKECAVFGVKSKEWGEEVCAAIVSEGEIRGEVLKSFLEKRLASYKIPKRFVRFEELPKTSLGKIRRDEVKNLAKSILNS